MSSALDHQRTGRGEPMLLVHGIGHRRQMWHPVVDRLRDRFDLLAPDLPGFGQSPRLPAERVPTPAHLADALETLMDATGWETAHLVGNSLGGWLTLELARRGRGRSVTALMPAGLWRDGHGSDSRRHRTLFGVWQGLTRLPRADTLIRHPWVRTVALAGLFGRPWRIPADVAAGDATNLRDSDTHRTMQALHGRRFTGGRAMDLPVTVVLGSRDPLIRRHDLDLSELPPQTRVTMLRGAGHVPTWDAPDVVAATIAATASTGSEPHRYSGTSAGGVMRLR